MRRCRPSSTLFPYTTLFRSVFSELLMPEGQITRAAPNDSAERGIKRGVEIVKTLRSEEHTLNSSHPSISYAVFCLKKKKEHGPARLHRSRQRSLVDPDAPAC